MKRSGKARKRSLRGKYRRLDSFTRWQRGEVICNSRCRVLSEGESCNNYFIGISAQSGNKRSVVFELFVLQNFPLP